MFKAAFDGMYHQEQIKDYIREVERDGLDERRGREKGTKIPVGAVIAGAGLALLVGLGNFGQIMTILGLTR